MSDTDTYPCCKGGQGRADSEIEEGVFLWAIVLGCLIGTVVAGWCIWKALA